MKAPAQVPFLAYCMNCNAVCPGTRAGAFPFFGERRPPIRFPGLQVSWLHSVPTYTDKSEKQTWKKRRFFAIISTSCFLREKDTEKPGPVLLHKRGCRKCIIKCVSGSSLIPVCTGIGIQNKKSLCWRQYQERQKSGSQNSLFSFVFCLVVRLKQLSAGTNPARNVRFFACFSAFPR